MDFHSYAHNSLPYTNIESYKFILPYNNFFNEFLHYYIYYTFNLSSHIKYLV